MGGIFNRRDELDPLDAITHRRDPLGGEIEIPKGTTGGYNKEAVQMASRNAYQDATDEVASGNNLKAGLLGAGVDLALKGVGAAIEGKAIKEQRAENERKTMEELFKQEKQMRVQHRLDKRQEFLADIQRDGADMLERSLNMQRVKKRRDDNLEQTLARMNQRMLEDEAFKDAVRGL